MADFDHVKIAVRCRPLLEEERSRIQVIIKTDEENDKLIAFYPESKEGLLYNYDYFFPEETSQLDVFQVVGQEMVALCMGGYNSCCIGYGPSAAGKTHTFFGSKQEHGLIQMTTKELFDQIKAEPENIQYDVTFTYWEMNADHIRDALNIANKENLPVRKNPKHGGIYIPNLTEVSVNSWDELDNCIMTGNITRIKLAAERQARWHGFLKLKLVKHDKNNPDKIYTSTMLFGHLKGPDRVGQKGAQGTVMKHGSSVNKSITLLGAAMQHVVEMRRRKLNSVLADETLDYEQTQAKLAQTQKELLKDSESLFAECKLTQILTEAFNGGTGTILLANVSATDYHETTDTLENLQNAQQIQVALKQNVQTTKTGFVHKKLQDVQQQVPENPLAEGHPLTELEEKVKVLAEKYDHLLQGTERPETPPQQMPEVAPQELPRGQRWKQSDAKANKHGTRSTVYIPTSRGGKNTYKGQWANSLKAGYGEQITELSKYVGEWGGGLRDGEGTLHVRKSKTDEWKRIYKGSWRADKRHGYGTNWYDNGDIYEGYWQDGKRSGVGKLYIINGDKIEGQWRNDKTEGWATLYLKNGDWFEGHWHNGLREGPGVWYYESKEQLYIGQWHLGVAKCGTVEDMERKEDNTNSHFLPRVGVLCVDKVLDDTKDKLKRQRELISGGLGEQSLDYSLCEDDMEDDIPEEDSARLGGEDVPSPTKKGAAGMADTLQQDIEEYIEAVGDDIGGDSFAQIKKLHKQQAAAADGAAAAKMASY
eukprot:TRINITY_DN67493_c1_g2_i1.p1 TRINITY_DN67493_c1_g2~~TRINITY_DN67493_c1_g2_i1.p1  ORF type:complete len:762 (+),score=120.70 TRINITY_DN67493_c1_g2_i1:64-2349(+)